jgi:hypothetical protein
MMVAWLMMSSLQEELSYKNSDATTVSRRDKTESSCVVV